MKKGIVILIMMLFLAVGGCDLLDSHKLTQEQITAVTNYTDSLNAKLKIYQQIANELAATLEMGGVIDADELDKLAKINEEIDRITPQITALSAAIRAGQYSENDPDIIKILNAVSAANQASSTFNPYAAIIDGGLTLALVIVGWFAKRKNDQKKVAQAEAALATGTLKNVVTGVAISSNPSSAEVKSNIKNSPAQKALIASLKPEVIPMPPVKAPAA